MVINWPSRRAAAKSQAAAKKAVAKKAAQKSTTKKSMNKADVVDALAQKLGTDRREAAEAVENVIDTIVRAVHKGDSVTITGFGVFEQRRRAARVARNPRTGETVRVKPTSVPVFRPGAQFKAVVAGDEHLPAEGPAVKRGAAAGTARKAAKKTAKGSTAKKAVKRTAATKASGKKATAKKVVKKAAAKKVVKKAAAKKVVERTDSMKSVAKKSTARKAPAKRGRR